VAREVVARITGRGGTLSFDPNLRPEILDTPGLREALDEVLAQTNLFLPSGEEIYLFTEADDEAAAVKELLERGVGDIVINAETREQATSIGPAAPMWLPSRRMKSIRPAPVTVSVVPSSVSGWRALRPKPHFASPMPPAPMRSPR
jgi:sugar/nucleoside kinase (ribokinase family)